MKIQIPKEESFLCPEGCYQAVLEEIKEIKPKKNKGETKCRLVWSIDYPNAENVQYKAGKNYEQSLKRGSNLREDLEALGIQITGGEFDFDSLIGLKHDLQIVHIDNEEHVHPFVWVNRIASLGTFTNN